MSFNVGDIAIVQHAEQLDFNGQEVTIVHGLKERNIHMRGKVKRGLCYVIQLQDTTIGVRFAEPYQLKKPPSGNQPGSWDEIELWQPPVTIDIPR